MDPVRKTEDIDHHRRRLLSTAATGMAVTGIASLLPSQSVAAPEGDAVYETLKVSKDGAVLFAEIAAPPMNLLGPELVRDLVSLIQRAEADDAVRVLVFKSADPDYFIPHVDVTRIKEYREEAAKLTGEASIAPAVPASERKPPRHHRADRGSRTRRRQRVRAGVRHAFRRARVGDFQSAGAGARCDSRWRRRATPHAPHGPREGARGYVGRGGLRRGAGRTVRLDQSRVARQRARRFRQIARSSHRQVSNCWRRRGQGPGERDRARAGRGLPSRFRSLRRGLAQARGPEPLPSRDSSAASRPETRNWIWRGCSATWATIDGERHNIP